VDATLSIQVHSVIELDIKNIPHGYLVNPNMFSLTVHCFNPKSEPGNLVNLVSP